MGQLERYSSVVKQIDASMQDFYEFTVDLDILFVRNPGKKSIFVDLISLTMFTRSLIIPPCSLTT